MSKDNAEKVFAGMIKRNKEVLALQKKMLESQEEMWDHLLRVNKSRLIHHIEVMIPVPAADEFITAVLNAKAYIDKYYFTIPKNMVLPKSETIREILKEISHLSGGFQEGMFLGMNVSYYDPPKHDTYLGEYIIISAEKVDITE